MKDVIQDAIDVYGIEDSDVEAFYAYIEHVIDSDEGFSMDRRGTWRALAESFGDRYIASHSSHAEFAKAYYGDSGELVGMPKVLVANVQWLGVWYDALEEHYLVLDDYDVYHYFRKEGM